MCFHLNVHQVARVDISADGCLLEGRPKEMHWWQRLEFFDDQGTRLGELTLHLANFDAALPLGGQPPYWGINPQSPALAMLDGEAPF